MEGRQPKEKKGEWRRAKATAQRGEAVAEQVLLSYMSRGSRGHAV